MKRFLTGALLASAIAWPAYADIGSRGISGNRVPFFSDTVRVTPPSGRNAFSSSGFAVDGSGAITAMSLTETQTSTATANPFVFNLITNTDGVNGGAIGFKVNHGITTGAVGNHIAIEAIFGVNTAPTTAGTYVSVWPFNFVNVNAGGTSPTPAGAALATNPQVQLTGSATFWTEAAGEEVDVEVDTGGSVYAKFGINITTIGSDAVQGSSYDAALSIGSINASPGWKNGILFTNWNGGASTPVSTTGTLIGSDAAFTVKYGVDLSSFTFTGAAFLAALATPASAAATCKTGSVKWDTGFIYICTATDTWKRVAIATWP